VEKGTSIDDTTSDASSSQRQRRDLIPSLGQRPRKQDLFETEG